MEFLYKITSSNDNISYNLVSLINHDGDSLDCGHYISDVLMPTREFGGTVMMTISLKLVIYQKGFILERESQKNVMSGSTDVLFVVYIRTRHVKKYISIFQEFANMSKINHTKKVIEDLNVFRKYFRVR